MIRSRILLWLLVCGVLATGPAQAQVAKPGNDVLSAISFTSDKLALSEPVEDFNGVQSLLPPSLQNGWAAFRMGANGEWKAVVDKRNGQISLAEGAGIP